MLFRQPRHAASSNILQLLPTIGPALTRNQIQIAPGDYTRHTLATRIEKSTLCLMRVHYAITLDRDDPHAS